MEVRSCPRCGHVGTGVGHFQRLSHVALLLGLSVFSWGFGGLVYYVVRRKRMICAQCGLGWHHARIPGPGVAGQPLLTGYAGTDLVGRGTEFGAVGPLPRGGVGRRVLGVAIMLFAALMVTVGVANAAVEAIVFGTVAGALGTGTLWWGTQAREARRLAIIAGLQRRVLLLATEKGGTLTVTGVAASLNLSLSAAEEVLDRMDDGLRVRSEVTNEGIIVYEFPEFRHNPSLESGSAG